MPKGLKKKEQQLTKMMCIIFGCFIVTYMPGVFVKLVSQLDSNPLIAMLIS